MPFRINRKAFGLTYSCPVDMDKNPINSCEELRDWLRDQFGEIEYAVAEEMHKSDNGEEHPTKNHFHVYAKFDKNVNSTNPRVFDYKDVHPNIIDGKPGNGWIAYVLGVDGKKQVRHITNRENNVYAQAIQLAKTDINDAIELMCKKRPREMVLYGRSVRANLEGLTGYSLERTTYMGPHLKFPTLTKTISIVGIPGIGKTQMAMYWISHLTQNQWIYCKGTLAALKHLNPKIHKGILFDDVEIPEDMSIIQWNCLVSHDEDGYIKARYNDYYLPAGLIKIFISNPGQLKIPQHGSVQRRIDQYVYENGRLKSIA